jgi:ABC-type glycerol-3-phosphate transport system substrate-binding protein
MKIRATGRLNRRAFLQVGSTSAVGILLAACSAPAAPQSSAPPPAATTAPAAKPAAAAPTTAAAAAPAAATKPIKANLQFLFADGPPQKEKLESIVDKFKAKNPDAQIEVVWSPWGEFETKIVAMHSSGTPPDFHQIDDDAVPFFAMRDLLMPVDAVLKDHQVDQKDYHPMIWDLTTVQGKVMALTLALKPRAYIYNVDLFDKAGIKAPTTWADAWSADTLLENAKKLTQGDVFGFSQDYWIWDSIPAMNGGTHFDKDWTTYNEPDFADTYQWIADLAYKHKVTPPFDVKTQMGELKMFQAGKIAIWNSGVYNTKDLNSAPGLKWDVMPVAKLAKDAKAEASLFTFAMAKATKDPDGTATFASFFMGQEAQEILAANGDLMPSKTSVQTSKIFADPDRQPKNVKIWTESLDQQGRWPFLYNGIELRDQIKPMVDLIWAGQKPAKEALESARPKIMELLKVSQEKMKQ